MASTDEHAWPYAQNLRAIRGSLSAEKAARKVDVVRQTWVAWESGAIVPRHDNLKAIVEAFDCPPELIGYEPPRGYELVPTEWIRNEHDTLHAKLDSIELQNQMILEMLRRTAR